MREPWQAGDLMLVDNVRTAHSREAFEGPREVLVAMADPVRLADCSPTGRGGRPMTDLRSVAADPATSQDAEPGQVSVPPFAVISGGQVQHALQGREQQRGREAPSRRRDSARWKSPR